MVEKMTAVWLIILTVLVCAAIPAVLIWITTMPSAKLILTAAQSVHGILASLAS